MAVEEVIDVGGHSHSASSSAVVRAGQQLFAHQELAAARLFEIRGAHAIALAGGPDPSPNSTAGPDTVQGPDWSNALPTNTTASTD